MTTPLQTLHPDYSGNPLVQAVKAFVRSALQHSVEDIKHCDIIQKANDGYAEFSLRFGDGPYGYKGSIRQGPDNTWSVHTVQAFVTTTDSQPTMTWTPIEPTADELRWIEQQRKLQNELLSGLQLISLEHLEENYNA